MGSFISTPCLLGIIQLFCGFRLVVFFFLTRLISVSDISFFFVVPFYLILSDFEYLFKPFWLFLFYQLSVFVSFGPFVYFCLLLFLTASKNSLYVLEMNPLLAVNTTDIFTIMYSSPLCP